MEEQGFIIRGVAHDEKVAKFAILGVPNQPGVAHKVFAALSDANIDVDMIVQSIRNVEQDITDIIFTVEQNYVAEAKTVIEGVAQKLCALGVEIDEDVAKVSIVGAGMLGAPGVAAKMFGALAREHVNIEIISTSEISISCLIKTDRLRAAVNAIHNEFFPID